MLSDISKLMFKILDRARISNVFLALGFLITIVTLGLDNPTGLQIGIITLAFGGLFRILRIVTGAIPRQDYRHPSFARFLMNLFKFLLWLGALGLYLYSINRVFPLFM